MEALYLECSKFKSPKNVFFQNFECSLGVVMDEWNLIHSVVLLLLCPACIEKLLLLFEGLRVLVQRGVVILTKPRKHSITIIIVVAIRCLWWLEVGRYQLVPILRK